MRKSFANLCSDMQDPAAKRLAAVAPGYIFKSRSDSTVRKYLNGFHFWSSWVKYLYCQRKTFMLLCLLLAAYNRTPPLGGLLTLSLAINWVHLSLGMVSPYSSSMVKNLLKTSKRLLEKTKTKKEPITPDHLAALVKKFGNAKASLKDLRLLAICLIGYAGFLRFKELSDIKRKDIVFYDAYAKIFIEKSKTDVFREGKWGLIAKTGNYTYPVSMMLRYIQKAKITYSHNNYIFRSLIYYKSSNSYRLKSNFRPLSYTRSREIVLEALSKIGLDSKLFGLDSLRSGSATLAANAGVPDRLFKRHGRWGSENAKDGYIKDDLKALLSVSLSLAV